jgi:hypothetical protein
VAGTAGTVAESALCAWLSCNAHLTTHPSTMRPGRPRRTTMPATTLIRMHTDTPHARTRTHKQHNTTQHARVCERSHWQLYRLAFVPLSTPLECVICNLLNEVPVPAPGTVVVQVRRVEYSQYR